jgi:DNA-binding winged helix-turn-helix (wHTH) protein
MTACLQEKWPNAAEEEADVLNASMFWAPSRAAEPPSWHEREPTELRFGRWCLVPRARLLLRDGRPVEVGSRAFDLLHLLLSRRGFVVEKNAIVSFVWPNTIVEESILRFQMAALRRTLGEQRSLIKTIPGRGYIFAADYQLA